MQNKVLITQDNVISNQTSNYTFLPSNGIITIPANTLFEISYDIAVGVSNPPYGIGDLTIDVMSSDNIETLSLANKLIGRIIDSEYGVGFYSLPYITFNDIVQYESVHTQEKFSSIIYKMNIYGKTLVDANINLNISLQLFVYKKNELDEYEINSDSIPIHAVCQTRVILK